MPSRSQLPMQICFSRFVINNLGGVVIHHLFTLAMMNTSPNKTDIMRPVVIETGGNTLNSKRVFNTPIRVLYYISYYQRMAGSNRVLLELVKHLSENVTPLVVLAGEGLAAEAFRNAGIEVRVMPPGPSLNQFGKAMLRWSFGRRVWVSLSELLPYTLQCMALLLNYRPDVLHVDSARGVLLIGIAARLLRCPVVGHMHAENPFGGISQTIFEKCSDQIITVCSSIQSSLSPSGRAKAVTVYNGVQEATDIGHSIPWLKDLKTQGQLIVACFASVVPFKGHHHLLDAVAELNRRGWGDRVIFTCVGDMPKEYQAHVQWLQKRLEDGVNGFVVPPSDPFALADALETLLDNPKLRQRMGEEGQKRARRYFSTDAYVAGVMQVYLSF